VFNEGAWDLDDAGNLIFKWVDNAIVTVVTSVHTLGEVVVRSRRRPRVTVTNRNHIQAVWGDSPRADVSIPRAIDDYNDLMGGVDLFDQLRGYHEQQFRVHRNWVPMFLFTFNSAVTNAYIIHKGTILSPIFPLIIQKCIMTAMMILSRTLNSLCSGLSHSKLDPTLRGLAGRPKLLHSLSPRGGEFPAPTQLSLPQD